MTQPAIYGIFGHPVEHSRSPRMQCAAFAACGINGTYVAFDVAPASLQDAVRGAGALGVCGFNVTLPHKSTIMPMLDEVDALATSIGAVNTVWREAGRWRGTNTDADGLARALIEADVDLAGARVVLLGAGGAVRGAVVGLARAGAAAVVVAARRPEAAKALVADLADAVGPTVLSAQALQGLEDRFGACDILVQGTSATLGDPSRAVAFAEGLPMHALPDHAVVTDMVYTPRITTVLAAAQARGLRIVDGSGMLIHQGALAFERWTGVAPPIDVMRRAFWQQD